MFSDRWHCSTSLIFPDIPPHSAGCTVYRPKLCSHARGIARDVPCVNIVADSKVAFPKILASHVCGDSICACTLVRRNKRSRFSTKISLVLRTWCENSVGSGQDQIRYVTDPDLGILSDVTSVQLAAPLSLWHWKWRMGHCQFVTTTSHLFIKPFVLACSTIR